MFTDNLWWGNIWNLTPSDEIPRFSDDHWINKFRYKNYITREELERRKKAVINYEFPQDIEVPTSHNRDIWSVFSKTKNNFQNFVCELISKHAEGPQYKDPEK